MKAKELFTRVRSGFSAVEEAGFVLMRELPIASDQKFRSWPIGKHFCRDGIMTMRFFHSTLPLRMSDYEKGSTDSVDLNYPQSAIGRRTTKITRLSVPRQVKLPVQRQKLT